MPSSLGEQAAVRTLTLGEVRATYVVDGAMGFSPATFFPAIPSDLWTSLNASGMVPMSAGGLLVESGGRRLLIDVGLGSIQRRTPAGAADSGSLLETLAALGHDPESVDVVALTHLHADHAGWVVRRDTGARAFPRARHVVAAAEWAAYPPGGGTVTPQVDAATLDALAADLTLVGDGDEILPGVRAIVTPGHSPGHTSYLVTSESGGRLLAFGDAFHHPLQLARPEWGSGPDSDSEKVPAARRRLFGELSVPGTIAFAAHFGDQPFGRIVDGGWSPVPSTVLLPPPRELS